MGVRYAIRDTRTGNQLMASRELSDLRPSTRKKIDAWLIECAKEISQPIFLTCTYRSQEEHDKVYAQGRTAPGSIVSWTRHTTHSERRSVDFAFRMPNPFDLKADVDQDGIADFTEAGRIAQSLGLQWGVVLKNGRHVDLGHIQDNEIVESAQCSQCSKWLRVSDYYYSNSRGEIVGS